MTFVARFHSRLAALARHDPFVFPSVDIPDAFRRAAVLIPFWREDDDVHVVLTRRSTKLRDHTGQTAFPGGRLDAGEGWVDAALREAHEEVGIDPAGVEVMGRLDDAWSIAGHHLVPVVGWLESAPCFCRNPDEVAEILVGRVSELVRPEVRSEEPVFARGREWPNTVLRWSTGDAWGLTAELLLEAIGWGMGERPSNGPRRLEELRAFGPSIVVESESGL